MKVYRVQRMSDGFGPYSMFYKDGINSGGWFPEKFTNQFAYDISDAHSWQIDTPTPQLDGIGGVWELCEAKGWYQPSVLFGFESEESTARWFAGWGERLWEEYHEVAVYEVPKEFVQFGRKQVVFNSIHAKVIARRDIREVVLT